MKFLSTFMFSLHLFIIILKAQLYFKLYNAETVIKYDTLESIMHCYYRLAILTNFVLLSNYFKRHDILCFIFKQKIQLIFIFYKFYLFLLYLNPN